MTHAYNEYYVSDVMNKLGIIVDYLTYYLKFDNEQIQNCLLSSKTINHLVNGNPYYVGGKSGVELCYLVAEENRITNPKEYVLTESKTKEFWSGWILAYYMWYTFRNFDRIFNSVSYSDILSMYSPYHEMDIMQFVDALNKKIIKTKKRI